MSISPDFTDEEIQMVRDTVAKRYGQPKSIKLSDVDGACPRLSVNSVNALPCIGKTRIATL